MDSYVVKSSWGGVSDFDNKGIAGSFKFGTNLDIRKKTDSIACGQALTDDDGGVVTDLVLFTVPASDGNTYMFGDTGKIYKRTSLGVTTLVYTDSGGKIRGAAEFGLSTATAYLYWATATALHRKLIGNGSAWSNVDTDTAGWPKALTSATWHTMRNINGLLVICNENVMASVGSDSSYNASALQLIPADTAKCLLERNLYAVIGTVRTDGLSQTGLYLWDQIADNFNLRKTVPANNINAILDAEMPLMQIGDDGHVYYSDLVEQLPMFRLPGGGEVNPDGIENDAGLTLFGVFGAETGKDGVYGYGRRFKNHPRGVLNLEYALTCDEIGSVKKAGDDILISFKNGSDYGVKRVDTTTKAVATYEGLELAAPDKFSDHQPNWAHVRIITKAMPASTSIECYYKVDKAASWTQAKLQGNITAFNTTGATEAVFLCGAKGFTFEYKFVLTPSANTTPEIYRTYIGLE